MSPLTQAISRGVSRNAAPGDAGPGDGSIGGFGNADSPIKNDAVTPIASAKCTRSFAFHFFRGTNRSSTYATDCPTAAAKSNEVFPLADNARRARIATASSSNVIVCFAMVLNSLTDVRHIISRIIATVLKVSPMSVTRRMRGETPFSGAELLTLAAQWGEPITRFFPDPEDIERSPQVEEAKAAA